MEKREREIILEAKRKFNFPEFDKLGFSIDCSTDKTPQYVEVVIIKDKHCIYRLVTQEKEEDWSPGRIGDAIITAIMSYENQESLDRSFKKQ